MTTGSCTNPAVHALLVLPEDRILRKGRSRYCQPRASRSAGLLAYSVLFIIILFYSFSFLLTHWLEFWVLVLRSFLRSSAFFFSLFLHLLNYPVLSSSTFDSVSTQQKQCSSDGFAWLSPHLPYPHPYPFTFIALIASLDRNPHHYHPHPSNALRALVLHSLSHKD